MKTKNIFKKTRLSAILVLTALVVSGCFHTSPEPTPEERIAAGLIGGLFRSSDLGQNWNHATKIYSVGETSDFSQANITSISFDQKDPAAIYLGTQSNGIYYSYNYGTGWFNTLTDKGTINDVAVDPIDNCNIYAAVHNSVYKSTDCARTWNQVFFEPRAGQFITSIEVEGVNNSIVYAGISDGGILKSQDYGKSWNVLRRFGSPVRDLFIMHQLDGRTLYAVMRDSGVFRSVDQGLTWDDMMALPVYDGSEAEGEFTIFENLQSARATIAASVDRSYDDALIYTNRIGIFRLINGERWEQLKLITPQGQDTILSIVVNPVNSDEIFYGTANAFFHSIDNGANWSVSPLPTAYQAKYLDFSPDNVALYLGTFVVR